MAEELLERETITLADMEQIIEELRPGKYSDKIAERRRKAEELKQEAARKREEELKAAQEKTEKETVFTAADGDNAANTADEQPDNANGADRQQDIQDKEPPQE